MQSKSPWFSRVFVPCFLFSAFAVSHTSLADSDDSQYEAKALAIEAATAVDDGLKNFGYVAGLSLVCVADAQKIELEKEVLDINGDLVRALGADRAFLFSASFGYGTNIELNQQECADVLAKFEQTATEFKQGLEAGQ